MKLDAAWVAYGDDEQYTGYFAAPNDVRESLPAILVLQEIWGVDGHMQDLVHRFAQAGYAALAPDLYAAGGRRPDVYSAARLEAVKQFLDALPQGAWGDAGQREKALSALSGEQARQVSETMGALFSAGGSTTDHMEQLLASSRFLREGHERTRGEAVLSVGFCMGGSLSALLACHDPALRAAAIFYGSAPDKERAQSIQCPVIGFYGELDSRITSGVQSFAKTMRQEGKSFEYHVYEGAGHAFFNDTRRSYHIGSARRSFARLLSFFAHHAE